MAKVLGDGGAAGLVAVRAVAVGLVAPQHNGRAAEQVERVARQLRVAVVARQEDGVGVEVVLPINVGVSPPPKTKKGVGK